MCKARRKLIIHPTKLEEISAIYNKEKLTHDIKMKMVFIQAVLYNMNIMLCRELEAFTFCCTYFNDKDPNNWEIDINIFQETKRNIDGFIRSCALVSLENV